MIAPLEDKLGLLGTRNMPTHNLPWSNKVDTVANLYLSIKLQIYATSFSSGLGLRNMYADKVIYSYFG